MTVIVGTAAVRKDGAVQRATNQLKASRSETQAHEMLPGLSHKIAHVSSIFADVPGRQAWRRQLRCARTIRCVHVHGLMAPGLARGVGVH